VQTGSALVEPEVNPVARAYQLHRGSGGRGRIGDRSSWDQTAVLYAAAGEAFGGRRLWQRSEAHRVDFTEEGETVKVLDAGAARYFLQKALPAAELSAVISDLMIRSPAAVAPESGKPCWTQGRP
jgi:hypothetical protein